MSETKKPNVIPKNTHEVEEDEGIGLTMEQINQANETHDKIQEQLIEERGHDGAKKVMQQQEMSAIDKLRESLSESDFQKFISKYDKQVVKPQEQSPVSNNEMAAAEEMRRRSAEQKQLRDVDKEKSIEIARQIDAKRRELMMEAGNKRVNDYFENVAVGASKNKTEAPYIAPDNTQPPKPPTPPSNYGGGNDGASGGGNDGPNLTPDIVKALSEPQWDAPYDMIPLPSEGKLNRGVNKNIKVAYLNASDENLLTSPHILQSDYFLEILLNRKILDENLRYKDLHIGDRNAIMVWLRATAYGTDYPITLLDEVGNPFEVDFDLTTLNVNNLGAEPDEEGLFVFKLPTSGNVVKFKLLNTREIDALDSILEYEKDELKLPVNNTVTYTLQKHIVEVNGERDSDRVRKSIEYMRSADRKELMKYINDIESGMDLNIEVQTPSGGSVTTLLPLNLNFFWPDYGV